MTISSNQDKERNYFEMFRRNYPLPDGTITHGDKPDVILEGERKIGIELTNFYLVNGKHSNSEQVQQKAREAVVSKAQNIYHRNGGKIIKFYFSFDKTYPILDQDKLAMKIAKLAKNSEEQINGVISNYTFKEIPELSYVYMNGNEYGDSKWQINQGHSVPTMSMEQLRKIISEKEKKSKFYRRCDAYWLLVVVDFHDSAQDQEIRVDGFDRIDSAIFEKVLVYKTAFGQVFEAK